MSGAETTAFLPKGTSKVTDISLGGAEIRVKTDATPTLMKKTREVVESRFEELSEKAGGAYSPHQLSVLVALNLAEELLEEREKFRVFKKKVDTKTSELLTRVESHLQKHS